MFGHYDWAAKWAVYLPNKIAVKEIGSNRALSYARLNTLANLLAHHLAEKLRLQKGDRVAILAENTLEHLIFLSAAQKTGIILVPINFRLTPAEIDYLLGDSAPTAIYYQQRYFEKIAGLPNFKRATHHATLESLSTDLFLKTNEDVSAFPNRELQPEDPVLILYTSGTTGFPKGALYTHQMMFWNSINTALRLGITDADRTLNVMPFFHTGGWNVLQTPFFHHGAYVALLAKFEPAQVLQLLASEKVTIFMGVPTMLKMMADTPEFNVVDLSALRFIITGGEAMPLPYIKKWHEKGIPIRQGYGLTEFGPNVTSLHHTDAIRKMGSIGKPNFYIDYKIVDDNNQPVKQGDIGELCLKGPTCTPGYWQNPEATAEAIENGWFHTGDYVREDEEGFLYVVDRKKNMYISGGENVYPAEVERLLLTHPAVKEAAVIGVPDEKWGEVGKAFIVCDTGRFVTETDIISFCRDKIAGFKIPKYVVFLDELPKNDTGKIDRKALKLLN